jgi:tetratricopeptide (TPR) repeat protein
MRHKSRFILLLFFIILPLLLSSCGVVENAISVLIGFQRAHLKKVVGQSQDQSARATGAVTLKPPYTEWTWEKNRTDSLTVQNTVWAITRQVGVGYNRSKSYQNTNPICREWTHPNFENKPWREAVEEIITPFDLTYVMEGRQLVLMKVDDARKREQQIAQLQSELADFLGDLQPVKLPDAVIILPLLDSAGKTTEMGTLLSVLAMLKAAYLPEKAMNIHLPAVIDYYHQLHYDVPGKTIIDKQRDQILHRFAAKDMAAGTFEAAEDGSFRVVLKFHGSYGQKEFSIGGTAEDLSEIPQWIGRCVYEYTGKILSPAQKQYLNVPDVRNASGLYELVELERDYWNGRRGAVRWKHFLNRNPESVFALYRLYLISGPENTEDTINRLTAATREVGEHDLLKFLEADWYHRNENYQESVRRFFTLLTRDLRNENLHERLSDGLSALGLGEDAEALYRLWETNEPDSYVPLLAKGVFYIDYAWDARGSGWAGSVSEEGRQKMRERMQVAENALTKALELYADDPRIAEKLIWVAIGLRQDRDQMEKWFQMAIHADPAYFPAYDQKLRYLMPEWYGDPARRDMFGFARACAANPPEGSRVALILLNAHAEKARFGDRPDKNWTEYYQDPEVWKEIKQLYKQFLQEHPDSVVDRNKYAKLAFYAQDYEEAVRQFKIIGTDIDKETWGSEQYFYKCRNEAYRQAGGYL